MIVFSQKLTRRQFTTLATLVILTVTIPVLVYLVKSQQIFKSRAGQLGSLSSLDIPTKKEIAMELVSSNENSSLEWKTQYAYIEDVQDGRGYTGGIIGFTSGTHDMLQLVQYYTQFNSNNILAKYIQALQQVDGSNSHQGLDPTFVGDWKIAANDPLFQKTQDDERDRVYFNPAVSQAKADGLRALGQFIYYDAIVVHGPGDDPASFGGIRAAAMRQARTPAQDGNEVTYLNAFLDVRRAAMLTEAAHDNTSRVDTEQRKFLNEGNLDLNLPLSWKTYGDPYTITAVSPFSRPSAHINFDLNYDGKINSADVAILLNDWRTNRKSSKSDFNGDGIINTFDYALLRRNL